MQDFKGGSEDLEHDDDFEIVENTNLVDNLLPMALFFCSDAECEKFVAILKDTSPDISINSFSDARLTPSVLKSLSKTQQDLLRYRVLDKLNG